jgi:RHS repeat-associated protein
MRRHEGSHFALRPQAPTRQTPAALPRLTVIFLVLLTLFPRLAIGEPQGSPAVSYTITSSKGWTRTTTVNNLGLATGSTLSGTGIPTTGLDPVWRADGSLASVELTIGGESHSAAFNPNGTLASLTVPGKGNIRGGHTIANGVESLTVDGVTVERKLDDTQVTTSGADIIGKTHTLTAGGGGYRGTVDPAGGAKTASDFNAAGAPTAKTYAAGEQNGDIAGESCDYENELLTSVTLPRGGALALGYSPDGAKDLVSAVWPTMVSGTGPDVFTIPAVTHSYGYDRAGRVDGIGDASGARSLGYDKGRLVSAVYTSGPLKGYEIIRHRDGTGRDTGFTLKRDGAVIHSATKTPNDVSDQISALASGNLKVVPQRDGAGRITGFLWGNATGDFTAAVSQTWQRGTGGRIETAGSDVSGAPDFDYLIDGQPDTFSFDSRGRRLKCDTGDGIWTYQYGTNGQLTSAAHPTLGSFSYDFDGIGRRKNHVDSENFADLLNRTLDWKNSQSKTLTVRAAQGARVWVNDNEVPNFTGSHSYTLTPPGRNGGWVEWHTLAVLEGQGEGAGDPAANPFASPDAKSEQRGAVWVPPIDETFTYDDAGNRESSAQWDYGWDAKNQLVRARTKNHDSAPQGYDLTFEYDSEGRRFSKHVVRWQNGTRISEKQITYIWDGWDLIYERHQLPGGLTTLERRYLWGPDIANGSAGGAGGLLLIRETKGDQTQDIYPLYDGTGHVIALTNSSAELLATYAYGPFGEQIHATGPAAHANPWRYATKYRDEETGLYYFGRRYLDPVTGQWTSRELLGESESLNLYSYCHNDPVNRVDVRGLAAIDITGDLARLKIQLAEAMAILAKVGSGSAPISDVELDRMYDDFVAKYTAYVKGVLSLQSRVASNQVGDHGMFTGWWHRDALEKNRAAAFKLSIVPEDDAVTSLLPREIFAGSLGISSWSAGRISSKYQADAALAGDIANGLETAQRGINYASAALGVGAVAQTAGRIAVTEGGGAVLGYLSRTGGGFVIAYAGSAAAEYGLDQAQEHGLVTANQAVATRMGIALFQIVMAKRQLNAAKTTERLALPFKPSWTGVVQPYKKGAMAPIEHILYRHGPESGFANVGKFAEGTGARQIQSMVDEAATFGKTTFQTSGRGETIYDFGHQIGTHMDGSPATKLQVFFNEAGEVMTAFPIK